MAVDAPIDLRHVGFAELRRLFDDALNDDDLDRVGEIADALAQAMTEIVRNDDLAAVTEMRGTVTRLIGRATRRQDEETAKVAIAALRPLATALAHVRTTLATRERNARRRRERGTVRAQLLSVLLGGGEHRPRDLAEQLDVAPAQVVRVLSELEQEGRAVKRSGDAEDRRATFYRVAGASGRTDAT
jgi:Fic family protein